MKTENLKLVNTMKQNLHSVTLLALLFLIITSQTLSRFLTTKQGEDGQKLNEITTGGSLMDMEEDDSLNLLMGIDECQSGDEECLSRRMAAEVHLDYIYTQHHKP